MQFSAIIVLALSAFASAQTASVSGAPAATGNGTLVSPTLTAPSYTGAGATHRAVVLPVVLAIAGAVVAL